MLTLQYAPNVETDCVAIFGLDEPTLLESQFHFPRKNSELENKPNTGIAAPIPLFCRAHRT